jgi:hypothetical protein
VLFRSDDGTGELYPDNKTGATDTVSTKDDDRPLTVNSLTINEGSPYAVFTVTGSPGQQVKLALGNTASPNDADAVRAAAVAPSLAVAFYPGCGGPLRLGYEPSSPLLLLLGAADDWTPAVECEKLAQRAGAAPIEVHVYPDAHHGFDGSAPVRLWGEVPGGASPGRGVHVGGQPAAREASQRHLEVFLRERWSLAPSRNTP